MKLSQLKLSFPKIYHLSKLISLKNKELHTCSLFFAFLTANSPKSCIGTSFCVGRNLARPIKSCVTNHGGTILSAIYMTNQSSLYTYHRPEALVKIEKHFQKYTLHIGAKRTSPFQALGCFWCTFKAIAPPMDSPKMKDGRSLLEKICSPRELTLYDGATESHSQSFLQVPDASGYQKDTPAQI